MVWVPVAKHMYSNDKIIGDKTYNLDSLDKCGHMNRSITITFPKWTQIRYGWLLPKTYNTVNTRSMPWFIMYTIFSEIKLNSSFKSFDSQEYVSHRSESFTWKLTTTSLLFSPVLWYAFILSCCLVCVVSSANNMHKGYRARRILYLLLTVIPFPGILCCVLSSI